MVKWKGMVIIMIGWIRYEEAGAPRMERRRFGDTAVLAVRVPRGRGVRGALAAYRASSLLARQRVRLAAFPADYSYTDAFLRRGIAASDVTRLSRVLAPEIALLALRQRGIAAENANAALLSKAPSEEVRSAARSLARAVRYLTLQTPDADALARALRLEYGVAAKVLREGDAVRADLALSFDAAGEGCLALGDAHLEASYSAALGEERCTDAPLLAALLSAGALRARDIRLEHLILPAAANFS